MNWRDMLEEDLNKPGFRELYEAAKDELQNDINSQKEQKTRISFTPKRETRVSAA